MTARTVDIEVVQRSLKALDFAILGLGALVLTVVQADPSQREAGSFLALMLAFATLLMLRGLRLYLPKAWRNGPGSIIRGTAAAALAGGAIFALGLFLGIGLDLHWLADWLILAASWLGLSRLVTMFWAIPASRKGKFQTRVAIVGGGAAAEEALNLLAQSPEEDIHIAGLFDDRFDNRSPASVKKHRKLGNITELEPYARENGIDLIIVAIPLSAETRLLQILKRLWELPVDIRISGAAGKLKLARGAYTYLGQLPLLSAFERPLSGWDAVAKSLVDRIIALCAIIAFSPIMAAVALAVKLESKGPVIFKQRRFGFNNQLVEVYKFRSMYTDMSDAAAAKLVTKDDPRVTRVGRIIRKTSLDELPQLFNVLRGTLSLVGPRPHATQAKAAGTLYDEVVDGYFARHKVKPGITGWAQINGWRGETDTREKIEQRVKHDLEYIDNWSLGFDFYILAKTPLALLRSENAY
jgi:Undecaprenyl-phosphate glucose phosphotransferase